MKIPPLKVKQDWYIGRTGTNYVAALFTDSGQHPKLKQTSKPTSMLSESDFLFVDSHVLATPILADLDKDNHEDLIIPVSYYFDP
jgi:hypothetical protein